MDDIAKKRRRLLTKMRVQRFRKRRKLTSESNNIEENDDMNSLC